MAVTESKMLELGVSAPDFSLPEPLTGKTLALDALRGKQATLVVFICNHCPFVIHVIDGLVDLVKAYQPKGLGVVAISSNDAASYPEDGSAKMARFAEQHGFSFPYLYDETQEVAKAYAAACTPDFYLFNDQLKLAYRGQMDGSRPSNQQPVDGADLRAALDAVLAGRTVSTAQYPSSGCSIKWKST